MSCFLCVLLALESSFPMEFVLEKLRNAKAFHLTIIVFGMCDDVKQVFIVVEGQAVEIKKGWLALFERQMCHFSVSSMLDLIARIGCRLVFFTVVITF